MGILAKGGLGMWKVVVGLVVLAVLLSAVWMGHGVATGIGVPYPDPTPEQVAFERYHMGTSNLLFLASGVSWLVAIVCSATCAGRWLLRGGRAKPNAD
jgi:hypothetical protein